MKTIRLTLLIVLMTVLGLSETYAQWWDLGGNAAGPFDFLGTTNNQTFRLFQNNIERTRYTNGAFAGYNLQGPIPNVNRIFYGINGNFQNPFSMFHMGFNINANLSRPWMNVGITMGAGADIMYTGILQGPISAANTNTVDAVVAWGCNDANRAPGNGPDNLRFLFLAPSNQPASPGSAPEGLETMRITPWGYVGIGDSFSNNQQPWRRAVVHEAIDSAQFRIAYTLDDTIVLGSHADFQVTQGGVLHVKPRNNNNNRATAIGFLAGEQSNPTGFTTLDVGGITRIRQLPDTTKTCLIIGSISDTSQTADPEDHYLTRLDFTGNTDEYLSGDGTWQEFTGTDCRWYDATSVTVQDERDIYTGFNPGEECNRGKLGVGIDLMRIA